MNESEFGVLRQTIAARGTVRIVLVPLTLFVWAAVMLVLVLFSELPIAALIPLVVLAAGFEAIHALHVGVERIGRSNPKSQIPNPKANRMCKWGLPRRARASAATAR